MKAKTIMPFVLLALMCSKATAQETFSDFSELKIQDLLNTEVITVTKSMQKSSEAPGVITVISAKEIENMGARNLRDVLEMVPGFEFSATLNGSFLTGVRGTKDPFLSSKILLLVDGIPYNSVMYGDFLNSGYEINLSAVERIEIIRGPGSALYGRNAFNGVINLISKDRFKNKGLALALSAGNYDTYQGQLEFGSGGEKSGFYINLSKDKIGSHEPLFDDGRGGLAPWKFYQDNFHFNFKGNIKNLELISMYVDNEYGISTGPFVTNSIMHQQKGSHLLRFSPPPGKSWTFSSSVFVQHNQIVQNLEIFKPGLPAPIGDLYPQGRYVTPQHSEYKLGLNIETTHYFSKNHSLLSGFQWEQYGIKNASLRANFDIHDLNAPALFYFDANGQKIYYGQDDMPPNPLGWIMNNGQDYHNWAIFFQDCIQPIPKLGITLGARYDHDSQFGDVLNPRGGLVWEFAKNATLKFLYGQAYRAPNCSEQFKTSGFVIGNVNLKPELIKTYEVALAYRFPKLSVNLNIFHNQLNDVIYGEPTTVNAPNSYQNVGKNTAKGLEIETRYIPTENVTFFLNYSYVKSVDIRPDLASVGEIKSDHIDIAPHKVNAGINLKLTKMINFNSTFIYRSQRASYPIVVDKVGPYALFNLTLIAREIIKNTTISLSVHNLFNTKYFDQESSLEHQPYQPGRSIVLQIGYKVSLN